VNAKTNVQGGSLHGRERGKAEMPTTQHDLETLVSERTSELILANELLEAEIAQHKQLQIEIARLSQFRETVIDAADIWLFVTDKNSNIIIWNRAAEKISGYSRQEVVGGKKPWLSLYPDHAYHKKIGELFLRVMTEGKIIEDFQTIIRTKSGKTKTISWNARPLADSDGERIGLMAVGKDITEQKEADEKMRRYQQQLRLVYSQLSLTEERLRRRVATELHDGLGQLLAIARIKLGQLRHSTDSGGLPADIDDIHRLIVEAIGYTRSLTAELSPPVLYELGLEAALEWLCEQIQKQHKIRCMVKSDGLPEQLDSDLCILLFQIIRELMHNITKHAQACTALISVDTVDENIRINVVDDGVGFDVHEISSRPDIGGFGLFNIRERLHHLGGSLELHSTLGRGTSVAVIAPLKVS
jgi:PAS domain S-box-containing protein